jgi:glycosyltransferase involved in cell wall biosynthesis
LAAPSSNSPDVSVITPTFRREKLVVEAIQSALSQEGVSVEVIVLDDSPEGSARAAVEGMGDPRVRYQKGETPTGGRPAILRNEGIRQARGRYAYFLDDDDHVLPGALGAMVRALDAHPSKGVAFGKVEPFGTDVPTVESYKRWFDWAAVTAKRLSVSSWLTTAMILFRGTVIINSTCMVRVSCARELGGYDSQIPLYEDVEFHMRGIRRYGHVFVDVPVLHYRTGAPSLINDLKGDKKPIADSYRIIHQKYRQEHGMPEYVSMKLASYLLPTPPEKLA